MRTNTTIYFPASAAGDGAVEFENEEIILYHKSAMTRLLFGQLGVMLTSGKEAVRIPMSQVSGYEIIEKAFSKQLRIDTQNGECVSFKLNGTIRDELLPALDAHLAGRNQLPPPEPEPEPIPEPIPEPAPEPIPEPVSEPVQPAAPAPVRSAPVLAPVPAEPKFTAFQGRVNPAVLRQCEALAGDPETLSNYLFNALRAGLLSIDDANGIMDVVR